jgi:DNA polymerase III epsilon subunit-like protein
MDDNKHHRRDDNRETGPLIWVDARAAAGQLDDVMIDIEALGQKPSAAVLSIGAVMFGTAGLGETFYSPVLLQSCIDVGLKIDAETVAWWMKQSDEARQAAFRADAPPLPVVLLRFTDWFVAQKARYPWCHGATFDVPILDAAYEACGLPAPWKFYDVRDTRTLYDLAALKVDRSKGVHHNALDDARAQAEVAVRALRYLRARVKRSELPPEAKIALEEAAATRATAAVLPNGSALFINYGDQPENTAHLSCTACGGSGHIDDQLTRQGQAGRFAWAAFAKNGNVIMWSHRRDQVKQVAARYSTPVKPVIVLHAEGTAAASDVLAERRRQIEAEGYDPENDDAHVLGEIGAYAAYYAMPPGVREWPATETGYADTFGEAIVPDGWTPPRPGDRRRELVKAGALILAEIERIDRSAERVPSDENAGKESQK